MPCLPLRVTSLLSLAICLSSHAAGVSQPDSVARVQAIRFWSFGDVTRIAIETEGDYKLFSDQIERPARVYFDLTGLRAPTTAYRGVQTLPVNDRLLREIRVAQISQSKTRIVLDLNTAVEVVSSQLVNPDRLMIELRPKSEPKPTVSLARSTTGSQKVDLSSAPVGPEFPDPMPLGSVPGGARLTGKPAVSAASSKLSDKSGRGHLPAIVVTENTHVAETTHPKVPVPDVKQVEPSHEQVTAPPLVAEIQTKAPETLVVMDAPPASVGSVLTEVPAAPAPVGAHEAAPAPLSPAKIDGKITVAKRDSAGDRSLVRVLGLKLGRVVIDAGHGGHDTGTIGPDGLMEKDLVLDVALRLGKLVTQQLGAEVVYTRSGDVFIPLEQRTKIANSERADLFISIHANSSPEPSASGVETFYFNLTSDRVGLDLATRENATSVSSISDLNDLLHKAVLENKLEESREFAQKIQSSLWTASLKINAKSRDRGVRTAPFVVLIGATMPSILAEIGFVSNAHDERLLKRNDQRQRIAEALLKGVSQYASTLSHVQLASAGSK